MLIVRENFLDTEFAAGVHRDAISEAIAFVETGFLEFQTA